MRMNLTAALLCAAFLGLFLLGPILPKLVGRGSKAASERARRGFTSQPSLEVVVPAYLEAGIIGSKIRDLQNSLNTYGGASVITVMSSDDATTAAARSFGADNVVDCGRKGKPAAINEALADSTSDVVVLTDANCMISPATWPEVVISRLATFDLVSANKVERSSTEGLYWRLERWIKGGDAEPQATLSVVGEFVAFRRGDFEPIPRMSMADDLWMTLNFHERGLVSTVDSEITTSEEPASRRDQWERRVRICEGLLRETLPRFSILVRDPLGRALLAHKVYRMTVGCIAFWAAAVAFAFISVPLSAVAAAVVASVSVGWYAGFIRVPLPLSSLWSAVAMQAVPLATALRWIRGRATRRRQTEGWAKIAR